MEDVLQDVHAVIEAGRHHSAVVLLVDAQRRTDDDIVIERVQRGHALAAVAKNIVQRLRRLLCAKAVWRMVDHIGVRDAAVHARRGAGADFVRERLRLGHALRMGRRRMHLCLPLAMPRVARSRDLPLFLLLRAIIAVIAATVGEPVEPLCLVQEHVHVIPLGVPIRRGRVAHAHRLRRRHALLCPLRRLLLRRRRARPRRRLCFRRLVIVNEGRDDVGREELVEARLHGAVDARQCHVRLQRRRHRRALQRPRLPLAIFPP
mmetsp:Transcript_25828/g.80870  ORF Transcript_25828/g.80870 Transcript_25828/m.80870 type:complete len:262 (-) Transcript_25828:635-1420(-)